MRSFGKKLLNPNRQGEIGRQYEANFRFSQFVRNFNNRLKIYIRVAKIFSVFTGSSSVRAKHIHAFIWQRHLLHSDSHEFIFHADIQPFCTIFGHYLVSFIVTSLQYPYWQPQYTTSYRINRVLMSTVCLKWIQIFIWCVKCLQQWKYTEQNVTFLMLTHVSSPKILRAVCLMSVSLTENK